MKHIYTLILLITFYFISIPAYSQATIGVDPSFNTGSGFDLSVRKIIIQPDGRILVCGEFTTYNGMTANQIIRLNTDGTVDNSFISGTGVGTFQNIDAMALQSNGKILIGGTFQDYNGTTCNNFARLNSDGSFDATFNIGTGFDNSVSSIAIRNDGKIVVIGHFTTYGTFSRDGIILLDPDGTIDLSFDAGPFPFGPGLYSLGGLLVQSDNMIVIGSHPINSLMRLDTAGMFDLNFSAYVDNLATVLIQQPDGKIIAGGLFENAAPLSRNNIARFTTSGMLDATFNPGSGFEYINWPFSSAVLGLLLQNDGSIIATGAFDTYNANPINSIARINSNGSFNSTLNSGSGFGTTSGFPGSAGTIAQQTDGKLLLGGVFNDFDLSPCNNIVRLQGTGLTSTFENPNSTSFSIHPNPTSDEIKININNSNEVNSIRILNVLGEIIFEQNILSNPLQIYTHDYPSGMFFVKLYGRNETMTQMFIKQ